MATEIPLSRGMIAIVDDADAHLAKDYTWFASRSRSAWYARGLKHGIKRKMFYMHRVITGFPAGKKVDHKNGNTLDNRRENLRIASDYQNSGNQMRRSAEFKCVRPMKSKRKAWEAVIARIYLGAFETKEEAARAYDDAARQRYGDYACLNFPQPGERSALTGRIAS